jgi:steroid delta-isomerase-like uncharacterized protein
MSAQKTTLLRRWFEGVWNEGREELMEELAAADVVCHGIAGPNDVMRGLDAGFRPLYARFRGAFADIHFTVEATLSEGDIEAARWHARMVHVGDDLGFPATQKPVTVTGMSFARVADGKIVESWDNWDMMGLMNQLGAGMRDRVVPTGGG